MVQKKNISLKCDCNAETLVFTRYDYSSSNFETDYEVNIEDSYCGGDYIGVKGRLKCAWRAFFAKPIYYSGISTNKEKLKKWLEDCLAALEEE